VKNDWFEGSWGSWGLFFWGLIFVENLSNNSKLDAVAR
jgi:hypothetical protein